jgi:hypothetical protein
MSVEFFEDQRREMVEAIRAIMEDVCAEVGKPALDQRVLGAMAKVPRHEFVPGEVQPYAYLNRPPPIGFDKTDLLEPKPDEVVLEIGTGLGYQSAVLAEVVGRVYSVGTRPTRNAAPGTTGLHQRRSSCRERLFRVARARAVRQGGGHGGARPDPAPSDQPAQGWRKDGDPSRPVRRPTARPG